MLTDNSQKYVLCTWLRFLKLVEKLPKLKFFHWGVFCIPDSAFENVARSFEMWHKLELGLPSKGRSRDSLSTHCMLDTG